ncbi:uncharacterized protein LOC121380172 isoform X1 [Gigantopelta aegis]|uniref:uncharacterized protein LOC121380172 isoform X1 n=1 Tax=Gigantopelta aegis TaxID=1735272 RepID=UPI001B887FE5|nr:uncharacterized protein LOC121380172 isoform X1 [Gigantopelta aegis]
MQEISEKHEVVAAEGDESGNSTEEKAGPGSARATQSDSGNDVQRFLMIDHGEDIIKQLNDVSREYKRQVGELAQEVDLLWHVLRTFMMMFGPLLVGVVVLIMAKCTLPKGGHQLIDLNNIVTSLFVGMFTVLVSIRYRPFHSAIEKYLTFRKSKRAASSDVDTTAPQTEARTSDSEASTVQATEEKEESKNTTPTSQEVGKPKSESEYFDMLPDPNTL